MFGEKNLGKCKVYINIAVMSTLSCPVFIFTSFKPTPRLLLVKIILIPNCKSVKDD